MNEPDDCLQSVWFLCQWDIQDGHHCRTKI